MAETQTKETKKDEATKKQLYSIAGLFKEYAQKGVKNRDAMADKIVAKFEALGQKKNVRGKSITKDKVLAQIGRVIGGINTGKQGWWSDFKVVEDDTQLRIVPNVPAK